MKQQNSKWIINLILLVGFLLLFYLDFTGLSLHQWLGVVIGGFAMVHLIQHIPWVKTTLTKFDSLPGRTQVNMLVDGAILLGMFLTIVSGVVMSTWLNLALNNYDTWRILHIAFSVETLLVLLVKLLLHWKMIALQVKRIFGRRSVKQSRALVSATQPVSITPQGISAKPLSRRDFLAMAGTTTLVTTLTIAHILKQQTITVQATETQSATTMTNVQMQSTPTEQAATQLAETEPTVIAVQPTATAQPTAVQVTNNTTCIVRCHNGCSFPGRCRRYTDSNGNNKCDLGECI